MTDESENTADATHVEHWVNVLRQARQKIKQYEAQAERAKEMILEGFKATNARTGTINGRSVFELKSGTSKRFDRKSFERDHPGLIDPYLKETESEALYLIGDDQ